MYRASRRFKFEAAHALSHLASAHACHGVHGHSYRVTLTLESETLSELGLVGLPFAWNAFGAYLATTLDGRNLSDVLRNDATAENLAAHLFNVAKGFGLDPASVTVEQGDDVAAEFRP